MASEALAQVVDARLRQEEARKQFLVTVVEAIGSGVAQTKIAEATGIPRVTLWRWLRAHDPQQ